MKRHGTDVFLLAIVAFLAVMEFGVLPFLVPVSWPLAVVFVLIMALTAPLHYGLMHETMHGNLFDNEDWNRRIGRLLGISLGLPWETMRFGHLAHHGFNRHGYDRPEAMRPGQSWIAAAALYYFMLIGGNDLLYAVMALPTFLPESGIRWIIAQMGNDPDTQQLRNAALRAFTNKVRIRSIRTDVLLEIIFAALAIWCWGKFWPVFAASVIARWIVLSILDNAPHYAMPLDSGLDARNTSFPSALSWLVLNQNFHGVHHHTPSLHWSKLPGSAPQDVMGKDGSWIGAIFRQFRGPVRLA